MFDGIISSLQELPPVSVYLVIVAISYTEYLLPPVPGDVVVVIAGYMAGLQIVDPILVVVLATAAGTAGFMTLYVLGTRWQSVTARKKLGMFAEEDITRAVNWVRRRGMGW